jgi:hypothetical protein
MALPFWMMPDDLPAQTVTVVLDGICRHLDLREEAQLVGHSSGTRADVAGKHGFDLLDGVWRGLHAGARVVHERRMSPVVRFLTRNNCCRALSTLGVMGELTR